MDKKLIFCICACIQSLAVPNCKIRVKWWFPCSALLIDRLSHQWQAFRGNIIGDNETKQYLRGRSSYLGRKNRVYVCRKPEVSETDWLPLLAVGLLCPSVCLSVATFFLLSCFNTFSSFPLLDSCVFSMSRFVSLFVTVAYVPLKNDFYQFQTLFSTRQLFLLCLLTHNSNEDFQLGAVYVNVCWCVTGAMYETIQRQPKMAMNLIRFKAPSAGLKATNMIVLVHEVTQRALTSSMSMCECMCERVYISEGVSVCVYESAFFSIHLSCLSENGQYLR